MTVGVGRVVTIHDLWTLEPNPFQSREFQRLGRPALLRAIGRADGVITPSETVRLELVSRYPELGNKSWAVSHGWQLDPLGPMEPLGEKITNFLKDPDPFVLSIGCLEIRKNHAVLLRALENTGGRLVLVGALGFGGDGVLELLRRHPRRAAILHVPSATDIEVRALMARCRAYVQPSFAEGFGMPVLDAMHFGKPVVLSDIPVFHEIVGPLGRYFNPQDESALTKILSDILADTLADTLPDILSDILSAEESELVKRASRFTWDGAAQRLISIYTQLASAQKQRNIILSGGLGRMTRAKSRANILPQ